MPSRLYVESEIRNHPRAEAIIKRLPKVPLIEIERYGEVFNPRAQNFRLQKKNPALILARKNSSHVLPAPDGYGLDGKHHYYFSHMLNCIYDCRYCFLQGMYQSAHQVVFVNYEDFAGAIKRQARHHGDEAVWFYSGYDCDSLACEPMTRCAEFFIPHFETLGNAWLELRTKSTQIRSLLRQSPVARVVTAFSFSDSVSHRKLEHGVPSIAKRIDAMAQLMAAGWRVGLRLDPVVYHQNYRSSFRQLLAQIFCRIDAAKLHSVSLGAFRLTRGHYRKALKLYPEEPLFAQELELGNGIISYPRDQEREMVSYCESQLRHYVPADKYYPCRWHD